MGSQSVDNSLNPNNLLDFAGADCAPTGMLLEAVSVGLPADTDFAFRPTASSWSRNRFKRIPNQVCLTLARAECCETRCG